jgi:hypothetical protein
MSPGFSMRGSGIYSEDVTREIVCNERCSDCKDQGQACQAYWDEDLMTDDWGNIEQEVTCKTCGHSYTYKEGR